ncbi:MAG: TonB-dependent receptor [candidate division KSB1 bacterium]|nr:TonB-dependent receptor [candidate division KSB1 bacterium]
MITGTFNAEYGRAMSGIVNVVTKDGQDEFHGSISGHFSNFYTQNSDVFIGLKNTEVTRNQDYKVQLEGPIWKNHLSFFTNLRYQDEKGYLNGIRRFNVDDYTDFSQPTPAEVIPIPTPWDAYIAGSRYYSEHTGDNAIVPLNPTRTYSFLGKLTFKPAANLKLSLLHTLNYDERPFASGLTEEGVAQPTPELLEAHSYKYKPDGRAKHYKNTQMYLFQVQHLLSPVAFYDLKLSYTNYDYKRFLYEDPLDPRYVHRNYEQWGGGFRTGGQDYVHLERTLRDLNVKYDITWQVNKQHSLKTGFLYTHHRLHHEPIEVQSKHRGTPEAFKFTYDTTRQKIVFHPYDPEVLPDSAISMDIYTKEPYEFSCYLQDKMEFDAMVINLGVRYDYFNPNTHYPSQLRNPANQLTFYKKDETGKEILDPERMSRYLKAEPQVQISPRLGLSYTLGRVAVLHFSYGHFFQMPPLSALYTNHRFLIPPNDFATILGNPRIKAEKTVQYEMGVWQEIMPRMSLDLSVYYRDIYDLQSAIVVTTYNQIKYGLYSNKDYGNAKGFELKFDYMTGPLSFILNYTLQYTRGNADNPKSTFTRAGQSLDPVPRLIPLAWDQRHTLNASVAYNKKNYGVSLTGYYNSGLPYTFRPVSVSPLSKQTLYPNTAKRPSTFTVDLKGHYDVHLGGSQKIRLFLSIYNLLDRKNEIHVNSSTGRAYTAIIYPVDVAVFRSNYNDVYDAVRNPAMFSPPREIKFGIGYVF